MQPTHRDPDGTEARVREVLGFWFGPMEDGLCAPARRHAMFRPDERHDEEIRQRFGDDVEAALTGHRDHWSMTATGRLALILLLDQFTRNIHRGTSRAWSGDARALDFAREGVGRGDDRMLPVEQRVFLYMPFEHSESMADQDTCVLLLDHLIRELADRPQAAEVVRGYRGHAQQHRRLIREFLRFPHRNRALGRDSTDAEQQWLAADARSFGQ